MEITKEVKKPVEAIQCANTFSLLQRKMYNVLLANAAGNLRADVTHRITIGILCKHMGYKSKDTETIRERFRELRRMDIEWDIINEDGNKVWTNTSPLSLARIVEGEGICEYEFTKSLVPLLARPAQYAKLSLVTQAKFKSSYGLALYENCARYQKIGQTRTFDIPTFRKLMGLNDDEYKEFFAMKRRVIHKAVQEVNKFADFNIETEYEKKGYQTVRIRFIINAKSNPEDAILLKAHKNVTELKDILLNIFRLSGTEVEKLITKYGESYIKEKVEYIFKVKTFQEGAIANLASYLKGALSSDYKEQRSSKELLNEIKQKQEEAQQKQKKYDDALADAKRNYSKLCLESVIKNINLLAENEKTVVIARFEEFTKEQPTLFHQAYKKSGFNSNFVGFELKKFVETIYPELCQSDTFDNYLKTNYPYLCDELMELS